MKKVLTIAGSDCSGGAGIQADLKTFAAHGVYGMSVITSIVAENTMRVIAIEDVRSEMVRHQLDAVFLDIEVDAIKIGMLANRECMEAVWDKFNKYCPKNVVIDPVMLAKSGCTLIDLSSIETLIEKIIPLADLFTPNLPEAEEITGIKVQTLNEMEAAAKAIILMGAKNVLIKGGHRDGDALDVFYDGVNFEYFSAKRIPTKNTHGTGCTFSSAIAANLALGMNMTRAIAKAKEYITSAILHALEIGKGCGPTHHFYDIYKNGLRKEH